MIKSSIFEKKIKRMKKVICVLALSFVMFQANAQEVAPKDILVAGKKEYAEYAKKEADFVAEYCGLTKVQRNNLFYIFEKKYEFLSQDMSTKKIEWVSDFVGERMRSLLSAEEFEKIARKPKAMIKLTGTIYLTK